MTGRGLGRCRAVRPEDSQVTENTEGNEDIVETLLGLGRGGRPRGGGRGMGRGRGMGGGRGMGRGRGMGGGGMGGQGSGK